MFALEPTDAKDWVDRLIAFFDLAEKLIADPRHCIIVSLWCLGWLCKQIRRVPDDDIPIVLLAAAGIFCSLAFWADWQAAPRAVIYTFLAVMGNKLYRRWLENRVENGDDPETKIETEKKI